MLIIINILMLILHWPGSGLTHVAADGGILVAMMFTKMLFMSVLVYEVSTLIY